MTRHSLRKKWTLWLFKWGPLLWLLLRSGTSPRRLAYPCQRAALASSLGSVGYLASLLGLVLSPVEVSAHLYHRLKRPARLTGIGFLVLLLLLTSILVGSNVPATPVHADLDLPGWVSLTAVSNVFAVSHVPVPECSLDGGTLPGTPPCNDPSYALRDAGVDSLVSEMEARGDYFYQTAAHPAGIVGADDVVVIKINNQWGGEGVGSGRGRMSTNTDVLKGLIWRILQHPDSFSGKVVVAENTQDVLLNWDITPANAQDQDQSYQDVVDTFQGLGYPVSLFTWDDLGDNLISGGSVGGVGYPSGEYARGNYDDAYILLEDPAGSGANELSYPKFHTAGGHYVSMRYGVWDGSSYDADRLTFINVPTLKMHGMAGATIAWKNLIGFVTIRNHDTRYGSWDTMHDYYWGYTGGANRDYGLIGREIALIRAPDLNVVDAIWVGIDDNTSGRASRQDILVASTDPFAVDWYASEYVLRPVSSWPEDASAARAGMFRDATRTNQNAAASVWPGGSYPYIDLLDSYDGSTPSTDERNQMNAYVVGGTAPATSTPTATATATADGATATSTATPTATATATSTATPTATPTPTQSPISNLQTLTLQNGVSPDPSYAGTTDASITTFDGNTYANLGGLDDLEVGEEGDADMFRFLMRFELDGWLPADIQLEEAWLELRAYDFGYDDDPQDAVAHRVTEAWVEGNGDDFWADGRDEGVTWSTARPGVPWASPGGDFDPTEVDRVTVPSNPDGWYRWDVTGAVRAWVNGTASNYGLLLEPEDAPWTFHVFRSSEYSVPTMRPRLVITYRPSCPADVHPDGIVDVEDIQTVAAWWHENGFPPKADLNHDEVVDILDIMAVAARWGEAC